MRIDGLPQPPRISQTQQRSAQVRSKKSESRSDDVVEISQGVQDAADLSALARSVPAEPNPRLQEIRARVESGYYDSSQVREQIADALLDSGGMREVASDVVQIRTARRGLDELPDVREDKVDEARQRVRTGFYDTPQARRDTADRILDELA